MGATKEGLVRTVRTAAKIGLQCSESKSWDQRKCRFTLRSAGLDKASHPCRVGSLSNHRVVEF